MILNEFSSVTYSVGGTLEFGSPLCPARHVLSVREQRNPQYAASQEMMHIKQIGASLRKGVSGELREIQVKSRCLG